MDYQYYSHVNRTLCNVLDEMRKCYETRNFAQLLGLIEEAQIMGNRMEAKLYDYGDIRKMDEHKKMLKAELKKLGEEKDDLVCRAQNTGKKAGENSSCSCDGDTESLRLP